MKYREILISFCLGLVGCASNTGIVAIGQNSFMVSRQAATGFSGSSNLKPAALQEADQFCRNKGKVLQVTRIWEAAPPFIMGNFPKAEVEFVCADKVQALPPPPQFSEEEIRSFAREKLLRLSLGMPKDKVLALMGTDVFIGEGKRLNSPYRTALFPVGEHTYEVYFYYTDQKKADGAITDDELTPVVFENGKVVGWGVEFLDMNVTKQEIRMR